MSEIEPMSDVDAFLEHHGIKGMRWGRRKTQTDVAAPKRTSVSKKSSRGKTMAKKVAVGTVAGTLGTILGFAGGVGVSQIASYAAYLKGQTRVSNILAGPIIPVIAGAAGFAGAAALVDKIK